MMPKAWDTDEGKLIFEVIFRCILATLLGIYSHCKVRANFDLRRKLYRWFIMNPIQMEKMAQWLEKREYLIIYSIREYIFWVIRETTPSVYNVLSTFYLWKDIIDYTMEACDDIRNLANKQFEDWTRTAPLINGETNDPDLHFFLSNFASWDLPAFLNPTEDATGISIDDLQKSRERMQENMCKDYLMMDVVDEGGTKKQQQQRQDPMLQKKIELSESYWHPGASWFEYQNRKLKETNRKTLILCQRPLDTSFIDRVFHILVEIQDFSYLRPFIPSPVRKLRPNARASASPWIAHHEALQIPLRDDDPYYKKYLPVSYPPSDSVAYTTAFGQPQEMKLNTHVDERLELELRENDCFYAHYTPLTKFEDEEPQLAQLLAEIIDGFSLELIMEAPHPDFLMYPPFDVSICVLNRLKCSRTLYETETDRSTIDSILEHMFYMFPRDYQIVQMYFMRIYDRRQVCVYDLPGDIYLRQLRAWNTLLEKPINSPSDPRYSVYYYCPNCKQLKSNYVNPGIGRVKEKPNTLTMIRSYLNLEDRKYYCVGRNFKTNMFALSDTLISTQDMSIMGEQLSQFGIFLDSGGTSNLNMFQDEEMDHREEEEEEEERGSEDEEEDYSSGDDLAEEFFSMKEFRGGNLLEHLQQQRKEFHRVRLRKKYGKNKTPEEISEEIESLIVEEEETLSAIGIRGRPPPHLLHLAKLAKLRKRESKRDRIRRNKELCRNTELVRVNLLGRVIQSPLGIFMNCPECLTFMRVNRHAFREADGNISCGCIYEKKLKEPVYYQCALCEKFFPHSKQPVFKLVLNDCYFPLKRTKDEYESLPPEQRDFRYRNYRRTIFSYLFGGEPLESNAECQWRFETLPFCPSHYCHWTKRWKMILPLSVVRKAVFGMYYTARKDGLTSFVQKIEYRFTSTNTVSPLEEEVQQEENAITKRMQKYQKTTKGPVKIQKKSKKRKGKASSPT